MWYGFPERSGGKTPGDRTQLAISMKCCRASSFDHSLFPNRISAGSNCGSHLFSRFFERTEFFSNLKLTGKTLLGESFAELFSHSLQSCLRLQLFVFAQQLFRSPQVPILHRRRLSFACRSSVGFLAAIWFRNFLSNFIFSRQVKI